MKQTLILTPDNAFETFRQGHLGFVVPKGLLMLNVPNDLESCVVMTTMRETLWKGHAQSPEAIEMMERAEGFALIERHGMDNPYGTIDFSGFDGTLTVPTSATGPHIAAYPEDAQEAVEDEANAFLNGRIGYRVDNGILKVQDPNDPDSCVLEVSGHIMWAGNVFGDEAYAMIEKSHEIVALTPDPMGHRPLQA